MGHVILLGRSSVSVLPEIETFCADSMNKQNKPRQRRAVYRPVLKRVGLAGVIAPITLARARFNNQGINFQLGLWSWLQSFWQLSIQISVWTVPIAKAQAGKKIGRIVFKAILQRWPDKSICHAQCRNRPPWFRPLYSLSTADWIYHRSRFA